MTYPEASQYLDSFINYEKIPTYHYKESLKLERIKGFLDSIGNPQESLRCIHVAGTKGKGSTCAFVAYILKEAGLNIGLYTSPHLSDFRERIRILTPNTEHLVPSEAEGRTPNTEFDGMISESELTKLVEELKPVIESYNRQSQYGPLSFFEVYTALAFVHFKKQQIDFAVLETGLGGRLDATNAAYPLACAITPISYEHTQKLGNTLREIATEKAGIIKVRSSKFEVRSKSYMTPNPELRTQNSIVISAPQEKEAQEVIREKCREVGAKLYEVDKDIFYETTRNGFNVMGIFGEYSNLQTRLLGRHQIINAAVAVGLIEALRFYNIIIDSSSVRGGLSNTLWPGRCEVISKSPLVVLDGAQNIASAKALKQTVKEEFKYKKLILVLGISKDKDIQGVCSELNDLADEVIVTKSNNPRATEAKDLVEYFKNKNTHITNDVKEARAKALSVAKQEDLILVTGSLFVVGEFRGGSL